MFDIGFWELVLIFVVGLVVLGPERLPVAIRSVSRFISSAKSMANSVKDELSHELKIQELQDNLRKAEQMGMQDLSPDLKASVDELKQAAMDVQRPYAKAKTEGASTAVETKTVATEEHVVATTDSAQQSPFVEDQVLSSQPVSDQTASEINASETNASGNTISEKK